MKNLWKPITKQLSEKDFETVVCNICGSTDYEEKLYPIRSGHLAHCCQCDLYYANPRRSGSIQNVLSNNTPTELYEAKKLNYCGRIAGFNSYLETIHKVRKPPGKMLDIGCYEGYFLYEASKRGWECDGVEPNIGGAKYAKEQLKLNVKQCVLEKAGFEDDYFDVVTVIDTLEHVPDPAALLREIRRIIKDNGLLVVTVPTIPFYLKLIRSRWRMFIGDHYYFFTDASMPRLLAKANFTPCYSNYVHKSVDLNTISSRLADEWQPNNIGILGRLLRRFIVKMRLGKIRFRINLFDGKIYLAKPCVGKY